MSSIKRYFLLLFILISGLTFSYGQKGNALWQTDFNSPDAFIENSGQFNGRNWSSEPIVYAVSLNSANILFTKKGLTYRFNKITRNKAESFENEMNEIDFERERELRKEGKVENYKDGESKYNFWSELIDLTWEGANENVQIIPYDKNDDYYSFAVKDHATGKVNNINYQSGYKKLVYKNIYDNIDVVYTFHPESGIKYSILLHPGCDYKKIKMKFTSRQTDGEKKFNCYLDSENNLQLKTSLTTITDHAPLTFYSENEKVIPSRFVLTADMLSFELDGYNNSNEAIIDPWVNSPTFNTSTAAWEVETDGSGNVYVIGGETPMQLKKYNSTGTLQWTYSTPWDTSTVWLGTLATDNTGVSFITSGTAPEIEKIDVAGGMVWHNASGGIFSLTEWWSITFNCDKSKLIVGGTGGGAPPFGTPRAVVYQIDFNTGNVVGQANVHIGSSGGLMNAPIEVRSISSSKDAKYIFLTHFHVGAIMDNFGLCPTTGPVFKVDNGNHLGYKCENYLPATQNGGGLKALIANDQYIYIHRGNFIDQRMLGDGTLVTSVPLTGGNATNVPLVGGLVIENSGLDVDDCGNVYAGSGDRVVKFDQNLNVLTQTLVPFTVYDVSVNSNGEVLAVGAQADNGSANRNGRIQSIPMTACAQWSLTCCDANICPPDTFCSNDMPTNLTPSSPGGTWSGPGITNASSGTFSPAVAGVGVHTIIYTQPCGSDSIHIVVSPCVALTACQESNGSITVSSGVPVYNWEEYIAATTTPITSAAQCTACNASYTWMLGACYNGFFPVANCNTPASWNNIGTGTNVMPGTNYPIVVTDGVGTTLTINSLGSLPMCSSCPTLTVTSSSVVNPSCPTSTNGSFSISTSGGSSPYDYVIFDPSSNVIGTYNNVAGAQNVTGLVAGTYTIMVTDNNACPGSQTVTLTSGAGITPSITGATSFCTGGNTTLDAGAGYTAYLWSTGASTQTINVTTAGTYSVVVTNAASCTGTASVTITVNSSLTPTVTGNNFCAGLSTILDAGTGYSSYLWSSGAVTQTITVSTAGTYTVTVTNASGCSGTGSVTVSTIANPTPAITGTLSFCSGLSTTLDAGAGYSTYLWSSGASTQTITVNTAGTYTVTVTNASGCTGTASATVTVNPSLVATITGATSFCTGGNTTLDAGAGYTGYLWSTGAMTQTINVTTAGTYSVTIANASGCTGTTSVSVIVNTSLTPAVTGNDICAGNNTTLDAGSGYTSYLWSTGASTQTISVNTTGTYNVTVTNATGCSGTGQITIAQNPNPTPAITGVLSFCSGFSTTLSAGAGYASYIWSTGAITQTISVSIAGNYGVTVTDNNGCTGTSQVTVTVNSSLSPTITGNLQICAGASTTLNAGAGYAGYLWSNGQNTQAVTVLGAGTYSVTVSDAGGCTGTASVTVTLNPNPTPVITGNLTMCSGDTTVLDAGTGYSSYSWGASSLSQTINVTSSGTYTVTVTNASGCTGTASATVTETNGVILSAISTVNICNGEWAYLTATATSGSAPYTYYWNNVQSPAAIGVHPTTTTSYQAYATDVNGCTSNVVTVTVNVTPPLQVDIIAMPTSICPGDTVELALSINQGGGPPYTVYTSSGMVVLPPLYITPTTSGLQWLFVEDGCGSVAHDSVYITVNSAPQANFVSDTTAGCEPLTVAFTPMNPQQGYTYFWNFQDGSYNQLSYDINPVHEFSHDGLYDVSLTVTNSNGCSTTYTHNQMIHVYPNPHASFISEPTSASIIKPQIHFVNLSEGADHYIWSFGDGDSSSIEHPWHWYSHMGAYTVQLIAVSDLGCVDTAFSTVVIRDEYTFYAPTYISPDYDDLNDVFYVIGNGISSKDFHMYIYDRWGEIIFETDKYSSEQPEKYGWNGSVKGGAIAPVGTYTWLVKYYDGDHIAHVKSGPVSIVR